MVGYLSAHTCARRAHTHMSFPNHRWGDVHIEAEKRAIAAAARAANNAQLRGTLDMPLNSQWMEPQMHLGLAMSRAERWLEQHEIADSHGAIAHQMALELAKGRTEFDAHRIAARLGVHARHLQSGGEPWSSLERNTGRMYEKYAASSAVSHSGQSPYSVADHYRVPDAERGNAWLAADSELRRTPLSADLDRAFPRFPRN